MTSRAAAPTSTTEPVTVPPSIPPTTLADAPTVALEAILIPDHEPPTGTELAFEQGDDALLQPVQGSPPEAQDAIGAGWLATRMRIFFNPEMQDALVRGELAADTTNFTRAGHWSVGSWVSVYQDTDSAQRALALMVREFGTAWQLTRGDDPSLGEEGAFFHGVTDLADGTPTAIYAWRSGQYVLELVAHGSVEAGAAELEDIAAGMQERTATAQAAASPSP